MHENQSGVWAHVQLVLLFRLGKTLLPGIAALKNLCVLLFGCAFSIISGCCLISMHTTCSTPGYSTYFKYFIVFRRGLRGFKGL